MIMKATNIEVTRNHISTIDGLAIILIILSHMNIGNYSLFGASQFAMFFGLILFTFSSGFKIILNHNAELADNSF